jgi:hypothetical protein
MTWRLMVVVSALGVIAGTTGTRGQSPKIDTSTQSARTDPSDYPGSLFYASGQTVAPAFEGWLPQPDGTFEMVFGYFNRNWEEKVLVPIGPENNIEPAGPDRGQPTYFLPRRSYFAFHANVPKDFGKKELVWTLTSRGHTEKAYATLKPDYILSPRMIYENGGAGVMTGENENNQPPVAQVDGAKQRSVKVGEPLTLVGLASDDGIPHPRAAVNAMGFGFRSLALGLRVAWFVYRGDGSKVTFDPPQFNVYQDYQGDSPWRPGWMPKPLPPDGKWPVKVTFSAPGEYRLRLLAHDGGASAADDVTVTVH